MTTQRPLGKLLRPKDVARILSVTLPILSQWRDEGVGPKYVTFTPMQKAIVWYEEQDVKEFIDETRKQTIYNMEKDASRVLEEKIRKIESLTEEVIQKSNQCVTQLKVIKELEGINKNQQEVIKKHVESILEHQRLLKNASLQTKVPYQAKIATLKKELEEKQTECRSLKAQIARIRSTVRVYEQAPKSVDAIESDKIAALNKELEEKQAECRAQKKKLNRLGDTVIALSSKIEQLKSASKLSDRSASQKQDDFEKARERFIKETRRWLVTGETPLQLMDRVKTLEMPT